MFWSSPNFMNSAMMPPKMQLIPDPYSVPPISLYPSSRPQILSGKKEKSEKKNSKKWEKIYLTK